MVDSGYWIALKYNMDKWHDDANKHKETLVNSKKIYITENILTETYNFLLRKVSHEAAYHTMQSFINLSKINILYNNSVIMRSTIDILKKYKQLSYTDANLIWHCKNLGIKELLTFDKGFDVIKGIKRLY